MYTDEVCLELGEYRFAIFDRNGDGLIGSYSWSTEGYRIFQGWTSVPPWPYWPLSPPRKYATRIGVGAPVYLAAVLEYLCTEMLMLAGKTAFFDKKKRILPRHILLSVKNDKKLDKLLGGVIIASGGVLPKIHAALLPHHPAYYDELRWERRVRREREEEERREKEGRTRG